MRRPAVANRVSSSIMSLTSRGLSAAGYLAGAAHPAKSHLDTLYDEPQRVHWVCARRASLESTGTHPAPTFPAHQLGDEFAHFCAVAPSSVRIDF
jgi:hypothetical protein